MASRMGGPPPAAPAPAPLPQPGMPVVPMPPAPAPPAAIPPAPVPSPRSSAFATQGQSSSAFAPHAQSASSSFPSGQSPSDIEAQKLRAQQMQAAARAAAGLPPLDKLTATSVTTIPPPITPSKKLQQQRASGLPSQASTAAMSTAAPTSVVTHSSQSQSHFQQQQPQQQQQQQQQQLRKPAAPRTQVASSRGRYMGSSGATTPGAMGSAPHPGTQSGKTAHTSTAPQRPTPQPTAMEGRLSLTAVSLNKEPGPHSAPLVGQRIQDLVSSIDPNYTIDAQAEEQVLQLADDFIEKVTRQSLRLAEHRGSNVLDVQDIQFVLAKHWGIVVPGLGLPNIKPAKPGKSAIPKPASTMTKRKIADTTTASKKKATTTPGLPSQASVQASS